MTVATPLTRAQRLLPPAGLPRALCLQSALYAVGSGFFLSGNAVFFTTIVGLSAAEVGLGISIAGALGFVAAVPLGAVADRIGPRRAWLLAALIEGCIYFAYPLARGFLAFVVIVAALALAESAGHSGRGAYTLDVLAPGERVRLMAFNRSALNLGFTAGALLGGLALASGSRTVIMVVPPLAGGLMLVTALLISRLPASPHRRSDQQVSRFAVLRDRRFLVVSLLNGVLGSHQVLLMVVFPLWLVERTDAPHAVLAWLFALNTVLAVGLQVWAARGANTAHGAVRSSRLAAAGIAVGCLVMPISAGTAAWVTVCLLVGAYAAITLGELFQSAGHWGLVSELSPADQRPQYQGAFRLGLQLQSIVGPVAFTALAVTWGPIGWLAIAAVFVLAAIALGPAVGRHHAV
ncbi:MFS transporter [Kribbella sp. NBC_01484]|uniref:MFS transporter n=1 Tax=Kribbella sp. NBC_01484 TaxID=2903579 RepID=UPI002E345B84|nr:MFS transporter [Kribbella sp. NBC_01484]